MLQHTKAQQPPAQEVTSIGGVLKHTLLMIWHPKHRAALAILVAALFLFLLLHYSLNRSCISNPQPTEASRASELRQRIDPNTATAADLAALPVIGPVLAGRIVAEREAFLAAHPDQTPYATIDDLHRVKGIGPATAKALEPYLAFPISPGTTEP